MNEKHVKAARQFEDIQVMLNERERLTLRSYVSIRIEKGNKKINLIHRDDQLKSFKETILDIIRVHRPYVITVLIFRGKSKRVQTPECTYTIDLGDLDTIENPKISQTNAEAKTQTQWDSMFQSQDTPPKHPPNAQYEANLKAQIHEQYAGIIEQKNKEREELLEQVYSEKLNAKIAQLKLEQKENELNELNRKCNQYKAHIKELTHIQPSRSPFNGIPIAEIGSSVLTAFMKNNPEFVKTALNISDEQFAGLFDKQEPSDLEGNAPMSEKRSQQIQAAESIFHFLKSLPFEVYLLFHNLIHFIHLNEKQGEEIFVFVAQCQEQLAKEKSASNNANPYSE
jgi:hypothetical protein